MKVLFGVIGAFLCAVLAVLLFGHWIADSYMNASEFQSPDEAGETHSTVYLTVVFVSLIVGYLIGRFIGGLFDHGDTFVD
ncbi:MAG: hypothetical protein ACR2O4_13950 [Hyphomicrobiaceae bacterium]